MPAWYLSRAEIKTEHDADSSPWTRKHILNLVNHYIIFLSIEKSFTLLVAFSKMMIAVLQSYSFQLRSINILKKVRTE